MFINSNKVFAAVTICAINYLSKALVLRKSFLEHHQNSDFYIVLVDRKDPRIEPAFPDVSFVWVEDLGIDCFHRYAFKYDVIELSTNVKPTVLRNLLNSYDKVLYIDPDIKIYSFLSPVKESLDNHSIVVTPHTLTPIFDGKNPSDVDLLRFGAYNLGFVGVSKCEEAFNFLDWWSDRCLKLGFYEPQHGLAVDQGWVSLAPSFFPNLKIMRNLGLNVAFWNLHERIVTYTNGKWYINGDSPLYFFHFSSFPIDDPHAIAQKQSRFSAGSRPDLHPIFDEYAADLKIYDGGNYFDKLYSYDYFSDGTYISPTLRRFYDAIEDVFPVDENPFNEGSSVYKFAFKKRLAKKNNIPSKRYTFRDIDRFSFSMKVIDSILSLFLMIVGPDRYFSFMKYLVHISSIRNQKNVIRYSGK